MKDNKMAEDKYILMGLNDERAKDMAEVLGNKTCKKIIGFLAETKEASEQDIASALGIPLNTTEYNLNKLKKAGLVVSSKNFFWSRKGRKIEMYQLAKKHIIISPASKPNMNAVKALIPIFLILVAAIFIVAFIPKPDQIPYNSIADITKLKQFSSYDELKGFVAQNNEASGYFGYGRDLTGMTKNSIVPQVTSLESDASFGGSGGRATDYSTTNIQVEGVDEADIVKSDGKYIYVVTGNQIKIVDAYPAENMKVLSEIKPNMSVSEIYINEDKLIVFASGYESIGYSEAKCLAGIRCGGYSRYSNYMYVYDVSNKESPILEKQIQSEGNYVNSRMIGDYVYVITNKYIDTSDIQPPIYYIDGIETKIEASEIYYWDYPDSNYIFTSITSLNVDSLESNNKVYLTGYTGEIYVSKNNIYLTYPRRMSYEEKYGRLIQEVYYKILPESQKNKIIDIWQGSESVYVKMRNINELVKNYSASLNGQDKDNFDNEFMKKLGEFEGIIAKENEKTVIHKIGIDSGNIEYNGVGEAPGRILNQFSMDEHDGYFRIATTIGNSWDGTSTNNMYVLDNDLKIIGSIEGLAEGESIYSARFMGKRAYMVTFKQVDPLFVIDLSNPEEPKVLGYLKIPGYSDYLHPYDENHVIGIGKDVNESIDADKVSSDNAIHYTAVLGLKVSLFDVTDVENPIEESKIVIGERGTYSFALDDHKAFLFDFEKGIMVIPISVAELEKVTSQWGSYENSRIVFNGAYVFNINGKEITQRGRITHFEEYKPRYGSAKNDAIGTVRAIQWTNYTKIANNSWRLEQISYGGYTGGYWTYSDADMDSMDGGINFKEQYYDYSKQIQRSLFMDDILYTVSYSKIKANNLETLENIKETDLGYEESYYGYSPPYALKEDVSF